MKHFFNISTYAIIILSVILLNPQNQTAVASKKVGFSDYLKCQLDTSPALKQARANWAGYRSIADSKLAIYSPTFNIFTSLSEENVSDENTTVLYDSAKAQSYGMGFTGKLPYIGTEYSTNLYKITETNYQIDGFEDQNLKTGSVELEVTTKLWQGFGPSVGHLPIEKIEATTENAKWNTSFEIQRSVESAINSYTEVQLRAQELKVIKNSIEIGEEMIKSMRSLERNGAVSKLQVLNSENQLKDVQVEYMSTRLQYLDAVERLFGDCASLKVTNLQEAESLELENLLLNDLKVMESWQRVDPKKIVSKNFELLTLGSQVDLQRIESETQNDLSRPELNLSISHTLGTDNQEETPGILENDSNETTVMLTFSIPLDRGIQKGEAIRTKLIFESAEKRYREKQRELADSWKSLVMKHQVLTELVTESKNAASLAEQQYKASKSLARTGLSAQKDVIDFQNKWREQQLKFLRFRRDLILTHAKFYFLSGNLDPFKKDLSIEN